MTKEDDVFGYEEEEEPTVVLIHPNTNEQEQLETTWDLAVLLANASQINEAYEEEYDVTFSSMLIAFLVPNNPLTRWFSSYVSDANISIDDLLNRRHVKRELLEKLTSTSLSNEKLYTPHRQTSSAVSIFNSAKSIRTQVDNFKERKSELSPLDVRHLMAAYIYSPERHRADLERLNINRQNWSINFLKQITTLNPEELEAWTNLHIRTFSTAGIEGITTNAHLAPTIKKAQLALTQAGYNVGAADGMLGARTNSAIKKFQADNNLPETGSLDEATLSALERYTKPETPEVIGNKPSSETPSTETEGISAHIASDLWTTEDALGYDSYAHAIYRFMTHPKTKPPLTISIQAPWGGGKTSLMRMIRKKIDPDADSELKKAAETPNGELTVKGVLEEVKKWIAEKTDRKPLGQTSKKEIEKSVEDTTQKTTEKKTEERRLTVWFNAWKYENTNQVWAGLIDAIMQQVAARLTIKERELFWLRLNLKRVDADKIRQKIHDRIFNYFWRGAYFWGLGLGLSALISVLIAGATWLSNYGFFPIIGTGFSAMTVATVAVAVLKYLKSKTMVEGEPAAVSLNEYLEIPNYSTEIGFIHRAELDLKRVLESIPNTCKPLVIFIDDLDRCSPLKISQVVEAVNLFLAGDFPNCMFVIGMDTEMVAAALQSAHKDMIANLPNDAGIPVGWRFMDKFVQLPFLIPPSLKQYTKSYIDSLFVIEKVTTETVVKESKEKIVKIVTEKFSQTARPHFVEESTKGLRQEHNLNDEEYTLLQSEWQRYATQKQAELIDRGIQSFNDKNKEIRDLIDSSVDYFVSNPRELKRFVNAFRFNYFLWWAQHSQGLDVASLELLLRWTVLSMKWPEVVRWLRRGGGSDWESKEITDNDTKSRLTFELVNRLKFLEKHSDTDTNFSAWQKKVSEVCQLNLEKTSWLNDDDLFQFFRKESESENGKRLSDGIGKGLW